jgi:hypothetical protein
LKKRTKERLFRCRALAGKQPTATKSFLLLFFKKEGLPFGFPAPCPKLAP